MTRSLIRSTLLGGALFVASALPVFAATALVNTVGTAGWPIATETLTAAGVLGANGGSSNSPKQVVTITPSSSTDLFGSQPFFLVMNFSQGSYKDAVQSTDLTCTSGTADIVIAQGGLQGQSAANTQLIFSINNAKTGACTGLQFQIRDLQGITYNPAAAAPQCVTLNMQLYTQGPGSGYNFGILVDNGITNNSAGQPAGVINYACLGPADSGLIGPNAAAAPPGNPVPSIPINIAAGGTSLVPSTTVPYTNSAGSNLYSASLWDIPNFSGFNYANPGTTLVWGTTALWSAYSAGDTGVLTVTGIPAAVNAVTGAGCGTYTQGSGTITCTVTGTAISGTYGPATLTFVFDGHTVINNAAINATLVVSYNNGSGGIYPDTKFSGRIDNIITNACAAEYASVIGKNPSGFVSTIRLSNTSGVPAAVFADATTDGGSAAGPVQLMSSGVLGGLATGTNLVPSGGTVEVTGAQVEAATGLTFANSDGTSRGRVRVFLLTSGYASNATTTSGSLGVSNGIGHGQGCVSEGFVCLGTTCSIMQQTQSGTDGTNVAAQNK